MVQTILSAWGLKGESAKVQAFGKGLINNTWKVVSGNEAYILQRINEHVFKQPQDIAGNIKLIKDYLSRHHPSYNFVAPAASVSGDEMVFVQGEGFFRLFPFVKDSHSLDVVETPEQAYEAAVQFGRFTRSLSGIDLKKLKTTIPDFHDLSLRHKQFTEALEKGNAERIRQSKDLINIIREHSGIAGQYEKIKADPAFRQRVTHHDTKISNILFDKRNIKKESDCPG